MNEMPGKERAFSAGRGLLPGAGRRVKFIAGPVGGLFGYRPVGQRANTYAGNLERNAILGNRTHTVPPLPVLAADIDFRRPAAAVALAVFACTGTVFTLWVIGDPAVIGVLSFVMKANTSASLTALAAAILLGLWGKVWWARGLAVFAIVLTGLTVLEYVLASSLGIDELLARDAAIPEGPYPGRMAPNAAQSIVTLGLAVLLYLQPRRRVASWFALIVVFEAM